MIPRPLVFALFQLIPLVYVVWLAGVARRNVKALNAERVTAGKLSRAWIAWRGWVDASRSGEQVPRSGPFTLVDLPALAIALALIALLVNAAAG
jgi:hypothetical protein